jgi:hypothetical protein
MVDSLIEMLTILPELALSMSGTTPRETRNMPVTFVSNTSRNPSGETSQND